MERPNHITETEWSNMSPRAKKRAIREANPAPARDPNEVYAEKLVSVYGGRRWQKAGKDRIYFNDVWVNVDLSSDKGAITSGHYDVQTGEWACASSNVSVEEFRDTVLSK